MVDPGKHPHGGGAASVDLRSLFCVFGRRRTKTFSCGFMLAFLACSVYIAYSPSFATGVGGAANPWLSNFFATATASTAPYRSQFNALISSFFPNSTSSPSGEGIGSGQGGGIASNQTGGGLGPLLNAGLGKNQTAKVAGSLPNGVVGRNQTSSGAPGSPKVAVLARNQTGSGDGSPKAGIPTQSQTGPAAGSSKAGASAKNQTGSGNGSPYSASPAKKQPDSGGGSTKGGLLTKNHTSSGVGSPQGDVLVKNLTKVAAGSQQNGSPVKNQTRLGAPPPNIGVLSKNHTSVGIAATVNNPVNVTAGSKPKPPGKNTTKDGTVATASSGVPSSTPEVKSGPPPVPVTSGSKGILPGNKVSNLSVSSAVGNRSSPSSTSVPLVTANGDQKKHEWNVESLRSCNIFKGRWVKDESYPMYPEGSCTHIDESFNCFLNGRPDRTYQKLRWQPNGCNIPRLNATDMLDRLRGKRLVFVGDSLNRNMWESLVCILKNSVEDKTRVFEASGRHEFRTEGSYSFLFKDYNCTVEFFQSHFLVQEWEMPDNNGTKKETLRLDIIERSSSRYRYADIIVFNTGHWWTHPKTSQGKGYYQEGSRVYNQLNAVDAFHKALNTWAKWVDANVDPHKTTVFFRGYSASHFRGGQWNSGGQCDKETEPIRNENYLSSYPPKMSVLESVLKGMKTPVSYLNITRMTDYRKDAHPSIYRKHDLTEADRTSPTRYQDCSHWCLPGVPDSWNELLYAELLIKHYKQQ